MTPGQISDVTRKRRCAWESLLAVDESIGSIIEQLKKSGEKRTTYIFFTSDNGFLRGEHRIKNNKRFLYEESARVPFIARGPGIPRGETSSDVVSNADVVPTFMGLSGATPGPPPGRPVVDAEPPEPRARAGPGDPSRGLRRPADPRGSHLAVPLHGVGDRA